jgi:hypothetical protein
VKQLLGIVQFWIDDFRREFHCQESHTDILPIEIWEALLGFSTFLLLLAAL